MAKFKCPKFTAVGLLSVAPLMLFTKLYSQEIILSVSGKAYNPDQPIWVSIAVVDSVKAPGAYDVRFKYAPAFLSFNNALAPENSAFKISPAVHSGESELRLAGFQGVTDEFKKRYTVLCMISFKSLHKEKIIDNSLFQWTSSQVYSVEGKSMNLKPRLLTGPVLVPQVKKGRDFKPFFQLAGSYLRFNIPVKDKVTLTLYNARGRSGFVQFKNMLLLPGTHAYPLEKHLPQGTYIAVLKGSQTSLAGRLGVVK